jgi:hypothetical protein
VPGGPRQRRRAHDEQAQPRGRQPAAAHPGRVPLQDGQQRVQRGVAGLRRRVEGAQQGAHHPGRHLGVGRRRVDAPGQHVLPALAGRGALEGAHAVEGFPQRHGEGELVAACVRRGATELLGRHVGRRAHHRAPLRQVQLQQAVPLDGAGVRSRHVGPELRGSVVRTRQAEVRHPDAAILAHQDVGGLEDAVDEPRGVRGGQSPARGQIGGEQLPPAPRLLPLPLQQRLAVHQLHGHEDLGVVLVHVVDGHHVGMGQPGHGLRLAQQPGPARGHLGASVWISRRQQLQRHLPVQHRVVRGVHHPHAALAQGLQHHVPVQGRPPAERGCLMG